MRPVLDFSKAGVLRRVQEFPAPLCPFCNIAMWVLRREDDPHRSRYGYACHQCGTSVRHRTRAVDAPDVAVRA